MIIFMTTNYIEKLEEALKRPGRVDKIIHFDFMDRKQITDMFLKLVPNQKNYLDNFLGKVKNFKITPALLQKFFVDKLDCNNIMAEIDYLEDLFEQYGVNPESFSNNNSMYM